MSAEDGGKKVSEEDGREEKESTCKREIEWKVKRIGRSLLTRIFKEGVANIHAIYMC